MFGAFYVSIANEFERESPNRKQIFDCMWVDMMTQYLKYSEYFFQDRVTVYIFPMKFISGKPA